MQKLWIVIFSLGLSLNWATTYYVDQDGVHGTAGDDTYPGTSWNQPWATITKAAQTMVAGDSVIIAAGTYREQLTPHNSGTTGNHIHYIGEEGVRISAYDKLTDYVLYSEIHEEPHRDHVYYFVVPPSIRDRAGPLADMAKTASTQRVNVVSHNGSMAYHRWIKGNGHEHKHGGAIDKADGLRITNSMGATYYYEPAESDTYFFSTDDRMPPDEAAHGIEITVRDHALYIDHKEHLVFNNIEFWGGNPAPYFGNAVYITTGTDLIFENIEVHNGPVRAYYLYDCEIRNFLFANGMSLLGGDNVLLENGEITNKHINCAHCESVDNLTVRLVWIHDSFNNYYVDQDGYGWDVANEQWKDQGRTHGLQICGHSASQRAHTVTVERVTVTRTHDGFHPLWLDTLRVYNCVFNSSCPNGPLNRPGPFQRINVHACTEVRIRNCLFLNSTDDIGYCKGITVVDSGTTALEIDSDYNCYGHCDITGSKPVWRADNRYLTLDSVRILYGQELHSFEIDTPPVPVVCDAPPEATDYHLWWKCALIDAGDPSFSVPPGCGPYIDIGAYEFDQSSINVYGQRRRAVINCYPNPTRQVLCVDFSRIGNARELKLHIVDVAGRNVIEQEVAQRTCQIRLPAHLASGLYFLTVSSKNVLVTKKIVHIK